MLSDVTGGMRWHVRALRRRKLWSPTTKLIAEWLDSVKPASKHLLLIGGSAGWMMSGKWLQNFERIDLVDLDSFGMFLFRLNHGTLLSESGTKLYTHKQDGIAGLEVLLQRFPDAFVFFDNVLGQHRFRVEDQDQAEADLQDFARRLKGREWGSLHDLFSGPVEPALIPSRPVRLYNAEITQLGLTAEAVHGDALHRKLLTQVGACRVWMDHFTSPIFPVGTRNALILWQFSGEYAHWLQAGWIQKNPRDLPEVIY